MTRDCPRFGKWIGGCQFEARYDKGAPDFDFSFTYVGSSGEKRLDQLRGSTYVRDVCIRCGATVERNSAASGA